MNRKITFTTDSGHVMDVPVPFASPVAFTDSDAMAFFLGQLTGLEAQIYEARYPTIVYRELVPVNTQFPEGVQSITYRSYDARGIAKFIGANADDLPQVAEEATLTNVPVGYAGVEYGYSLDELRSSQLLGMPLDMLKAKTTYRVAEEHSQRVAFFGDADHKMEGLLNHSNVPVTTSTLDWAVDISGPVPAESYQPIINDMNDTLKQVWTNTKGAFTPDTLLLPADKFTLISGIRMANGTDTSLVEWFKRNNFYTEMTGRELMIRPLFQLNDQGANSTGRMVAYTRDPECVTVFHPLPFRSLPPQFRSLKVSVPSEYKISGTEFRQPMSALYKDFGA